MGFPMLGKRDREKRSLYSYNATVDAPLIYTDGKGITVKYINTFAVRGEYQVSS